VRPLWHHDRMSTTTPDQEPTQLALLDAQASPLQFRLDQHTRQRGLAHVAAIRAQLAARAAQRADSLGLQSRSAA
jgi:hypothetical protein